MPTPEARPTLTQMMDRVHNQTQKKDLWKDDNTPIDIVEMIREEVDELVEAVDISAHIDGDVFNVVSEVGDVLYLCLKFCKEMGISPEDAINLKILRNDLKYPTDMNSNGSYDGARKKSKAMWQALGGDGAFSDAYLEIAEQEFEEAVQGTGLIAQAVAYGLPEPLLVGSNGNGNGHHKNGNGTH